MKQFIIIITMLMLQLPHSAAAQSARPKVALVLGGGGAKGAAHVGVLRAIEQSGIRPDYVVGTSIGGIVGGLYCAGYSAEEIENMFRSQQWSSLLTDRVDTLQQRLWHEADDGRVYVLGVPLPFRLGKGQTVAGALSSVFEDGRPGLLHGQQLAALLDSMLNAKGINTFAELPIPLCCIAVDVKSMEEVALSDGPLAQALRASMAIPGAFTPVWRDGRLLIDGGALNNLPVDVAREMGADIVVAVDLTVHKPKEKPADERSLEGLAAIPQLRWLMQRPDRAKYNANRSAADVYINPALDGFDAFDFAPSKIDAMLRLGDDAGRKALEQLSAIARMCAQE